MSSSAVFQDLQSFGFVHHRALNSRDKFNAAAESARLRPDLIHVLEGDLCWHVEGSESIFYFRHPKRLTDVLTLDDLRRQEDEQTLFTLQDLAAAAEEGLRFIIELKVGRGDVQEAMAVLAEQLQEQLAGRFWLDGFSVRLFEAIKSADSTIPTSLHTKVVLGDRVLRTSVDWMPVSVKRLSRLDCIDAVTLSHKTSTARLFRRFGATIDKTCRGVAEAGKTLILGGLTTPNCFQRAMESSAVAGYAKFPLHMLPHND